ncbi:hypothetical protein [Luteibacter sp. dw_328]|uniref:hypothetical protein n=1 Tax=Luteibacter sp. dw_328 TaxID=2719796 RepID=UPI001BD44995|nr:hypothetical protein [Luteibacter sp. dw_328]
MKSTAAFVILSIATLFAGATIAQGQEKGVTRQRADALVQAMTKKHPYRGTDVYPLENDGGETKFYAYQLIYNEATEPTMSAGFVKVNRRTGEIIIDAGTLCYHYPGYPYNQPIQPGPGVDLPLDCN